MRKATAPLVVRARRASDDAFIYGLSDRIFAPYSRRPTGSMKALLTEPGALAFVAEDGAAPVGFFVLGFALLGRSFGPWQQPAVARLNAIGVDPDLHRRGIGAVLLEHAEQRARAQGAVSMTLMTADTNARARRLFARGGFWEAFDLERAYGGGQRGVVMMKAL